ncbi:MAG: hypothetical protein Q8S84_07445 [bacterium]|nr:hypothetical protein [bacterium]MDP3381281.1 hypothetical protein [bacterium]
MELSLFTIVFHLAAVSVHQSDSVDIAIHAEYASQNDNTVSEKTIHQIKEFFIACFVFKFIK